MFNVQTFKTPPDRWFVRESRHFDFLYDSTYTQPSREDFIKSAQYGLRSGGTLALRPAYNSMFSGLKNTSRMRGCMKDARPSVLENFMPEYDINGMPIVPADTGPLPLPQLIDEVTGANRAKYAIRYGPPSYKLDLSMEATSFDDSKKFKRTKGKFVNRSIQTDYRESECQTDPYSPPYFLPYPGAYPKLLALAKLTWDKGLPFSLDDIVIIERALSKRQLEYVSREVENEEDFERRIKLMEELEAQQWADREKELDKLRQRKMELTSRLIHDYSTRVANDHTLRLERLHAKLKKKTKIQFDTIKHQYFRDLRKLEGKYLKKPVPRRRDIIKEYTRFDSRIYAPLARNADGVGLAKKPNQFYWNFHDFNTLDGITNDENFVRNDLCFDMDKFKRGIDKCRPEGSMKRLEKKLEDIYLSFKDHTSKTKDSMNLLEALDPNAVPIMRPSTPEIVITENPELELRKPHVVLLQKIARGRTIQKLIRNEMERNMSEILGMKLMYDMDPNCLRVEESRLQKLTAMKKNTDSEDTRDIPVAEVVGHLEGETLARAIDFLDKEMVRLIDERKIHALILLAERERKRKEAEEGGKRYQEEEARRAQDEVFKHVTGIHQATVDLYLEDIFLESCDRVADDQSRIYVQRMANSLNDALYSNQHPLTDFEQEELAADLVSSFMIPELHRIYHNSQVEAAGGRYKKASRQVVEAIFRSAPIAQDVITQIEPLVDEHLLVGTAAIDGGVEIVDQIITLAVEEALLPLKADLGKEVAKTKPETPPKEEVQQAVSEKDISSETKSTTDSAEAKKISKSSDFDFDFKAIGTEEKPEEATLQDKEEGEGGEDEAEEEEEEEQGGAPGEEETVDMTEANMDDSRAFEDLEAEDEAEEDEEEEEEEEMVVEEEVVVSPRPPPFEFYIDDDVYRSLAAKSVQVTLDTELGQQVEAVYSGAGVTVDELFDEVTEKIIPKPVDDSASDATLSDDSDT